MDLVKEDMAEVEVTEEDTEVKQMAKENPLWRPLMGKAGMRRRRIITDVLNPRGLRTEPYVWLTLTSRAPPIRMLRVIFSSCPFTLATEYRSPEPSPHGSCFQGRERSTAYQSAMVHG